MRDYASDVSIYCNGVWSETRVIYGYWHCVRCGKRLWRAR